ncbi:MAG: hypothetical protein WCO42_11760 [bacterium]
MNNNNKRFTVILMVMGAMMCSVIAGYFYYIAPPTPPPSLPNIYETGNEPVVKTTSDPSPLPAGEARLNPLAGLNNNGPSAKTEFVAPRLQAQDEKGEMKAAEEVLHEAPPLPRLAPDMFAFSSLPYDAPMAEFPLVLVGQKNVEWPKIMSVGQGVSGGFGGPAGPPSTIYSKPTGEPPVVPPVRPPPGPPGPPEIPPTPHPPPEVSYSGL